MNHSYDDLANQQWREFTGTQGKMSMISRLVIFIKE